MRIKEVEISNFRALESVTIGFEDVTSFIGPNGVGKSTVLRALDWFFNGHKSYLAEDDRSFGDQDKTVEVRVTFDNLSDDDRRALQKYVTNESSTFTAWKTSAPDGTEKLSANSKGYPRFNYLRSLTTAADAKIEYARIRDAETELDLPAATTHKAIKDALIAWESENPHLLEDVPEEIGTEFFGFNGSNTLKSLFNFVFVQADLRASEEAADAKGSIVAQILEYAIDRNAAGEALDQIRQDTETLQQAKYEEYFGDNLKDLSERFTSRISQYSDTGRRVALHPAIIEYKPPKTTFEIFIEDVETKTPVANQGHGFQRTLIISALQLLAEDRDAGGTGTICLAIEEPELYQHPIQEQAFAKVLRHLASSSGSRAQVMYATHSPTFIDPGNFHEIRRMVRPTNRLERVKVYSATKADIQMKIENLTSVATTKALQAQFSGIIRNSLSTALFANSVILVEGPTDAAIVGGIADREEFGSLERQGIEIACTGGDSTIPLYHAILDALGIPCFVIFDGDRDMEKRIRAKNPNKVASLLEKEVESSLKSRDLRRESIYSYFGQEFHGEYEPFICEKFAMLPDTLEPFLEEEWNGWIDELESVRNKTGSKGNKNSEDYRITAQRVTDQAPALLRQALLKCNTSSGVQN